MLLCCDIGNTFIKFAIYKNDELLSFFKSSSDSIPIKLLREYEISGIAISSVVPDYTKILVQELYKEFGINPFIIDHESKFNLKISYLTPDTLGIDRICSAEGAFDLCTKAAGIYTNKTFLMIVDAGTATTINIVKYYGEFVGGLILPGFKTMARALNTNTSQLPEVEAGNEYESFIGRDTSSSIASGILNSTVGLVEKTRDYLRNEFDGREIKIFVTGGNAKLIATHLKYDNQVIDDLVLRGVRAIWERNLV